MQSCRIIYDYRLKIITKLSIFADEMYSTTSVKWTVDHFGLDKDMREK